MAYDEGLAERVRGMLSRRRGIAERRMFGGLAFLLRGHMFCGVLGDELMVRVGADAYAQALARRHAREMDFTGRPLTGFVCVSPAGLRSARDLRAWVERGLRVARSLPPR
jgi:TfoX/Sxy family transcriptional regulator of competence genes